MCVPAEPRSVRLPESGRRVGRLLASLAAGALLVAAPPGSAVEDGSTPRQGTRIVLITIDALRYDSFAGGAGRESSMPRLRAFAREGQTFERFFSATSSTQPTHASLLTGLHPWEHGVTRDGLVLAESHETLAERLRGAGFETVAVVAALPLAERFGFAQGFDRYVAVFDRRIALRSWGGIRLDPRGFHSLAESVAERAINGLDAARAPRQFFWFHFFDPHEPYGERGGRSVHRWQLETQALAADPELPQWIARARVAYERDVAALDRALEGVLEHLRAQQHAFATHVFITADHGESFGEGGSLGHGDRLTPEQLHVPLVAVSPRFEPGTRRDVAGSVDLVPTLLAVAGLEAAGTPGRDLAREGNGRGAVGMSRTYAKPRIDPRTDGSFVELREPRFFWVVDDRLYAGDAGEVVEDDAADRPAPPSVAARARPLFERFARELDGNAEPEGTP